MNLRSGLTGARPALVAAVVLLVTGIAPLDAAAGRAEYQSPLYLGGRAATALGTSWILSTAPGPGAPGTAPTAALGATGSIASGTYTYVYTVVDRVGGETYPSPASTPGVSVPFAQSRQITVGGLPTGATVRLYRKRSMYFYLVAELPANASPTHVDNVPEVATLPVLPLSQHRVRSSASGCTTNPCIGYGDFAPGGYAHVSLDSATAAEPFAPTLGAGWIVDGPGRVHIAAGTWTFQANVESGGNPGGEAHLVLGLWKVRLNANAISSSTVVLDPTAAAAEATANLITSSASTQTVTHAFALPALTLADDEHLYLQLWRRQTVAMTGGAPNRLLTLRVHDGTARLELPAASTLPNVPALAGPAHASVVNEPVLAATFADEDPGDAGTIDFRVCRDAACADVAATDSEPAENGATAVWAPALAPGTYHWQARAEDTHGGRSDWTAARLVRVNAAPAVPSLLQPADAAVAVGAPALAAAFEDADAGDAGIVEFRVCRDTGCADVAAGTSIAAANGGTTTWTPSLQAGTYHWQARAEDEHAGRSDWSAPRRFRVNAAPAAPALLAPADALVTNTPPTLAAAYGDPDGDAGVLELRVCGDAACATVTHAFTSEELSNGEALQWLPVPPLAAGTHYWQARSVDSLGSASDWTAIRSFRLNAAPARALPADPPAAGQVRTASPTLTAVFGDPDGDHGRVHFRLCRAAAAPGRACAEHVASGTSPSVASGAVARWRAPRLADGTYYWQARGEDGPAAQSAWSGTRRLVVAARLVRVVSEARQRCDVGSFVSVRLKLAADARLSAVLVARGRRDVVLDLGRVRAGTRTARIHLRWSLERRVVYRISFVARRRGERGRAAVAVRVDPIAPRTLPRGCSAA